MAAVEDLIPLKLIAGRSKDPADLAGLVALPGVDGSCVVPLAREGEVDTLLAALRERR